MKFGENLYSLRKSAKMSQEVLAEKIGVSRQSVSKWENGEAYPEMEKLIKICKIFHCKLNDIIHDDIQDIDSLDEDVKMSIVKLEKEKQKRLKGISKAIYVLAKIAKICTIIGIVALVIATIVGNIIISSVSKKNENEISIQLGNTIVDFKKMDDKIEISSNDGRNAIDIAGSSFIKFEQNTENEKFINILMKNSKEKLLIGLNFFVIIAIGTIIVLNRALKHLEKLFENIYNGDTPFTLDNVHHIKNMTYLMIAITLLSGVLNGISGLLVNEDADFNMGYSLITILFLYSIAYIFEYGYHLQLDSKGKIYGEDEQE